jgi:predicted esterase
MLPDGVKIVLPQAPMRAPHDSLDVVPAWYTTRNQPAGCNIGSHEAFFLARYNQEQIKECVDTITELIQDELEALDGRHDKVFLGGFDKGCCIALATYL